MPTQLESGIDQTDRHAMTIHVTTMRCALPALLCLSMPAIAQTPPDIKSCLGIDDDAARLACYDQKAGREAMMTLPPSPAVQLTPEVKASPDADSLTSRYWELSQADKRGTFNYTSYLPNYFLPLRGMRSLNRAPESPTRGPAQDLPRYQRGETKIQLSLRSKLVENALLPGADLWMAYTQQSMWQLWNSSQSAP